MNFEFLKTEKKFDSFANVAITAEKLLNIDIDSCVLNCRRAMEFAVKWMYSVDRELTVPYQDNLVTLMNSEDFKGIVGEDIRRRMDLIRKLGNSTAHDVSLRIEDFVDALLHFVADNLVLATQIDELHVVSPLFRCVRVL